MTDGPGGGQLDDEVWGESAGHVGAAPAPNWAPPPAPTEQATPTEAASTGRPAPPSSPPTSGNGAATHRHSFGPEASNPYAAPAFSDSRHSRSARRGAGNPYVSRRQTYPVSYPFRRRLPGSWAIGGPTPGFIRAAAIISVCTIGLATPVFLVISAVRWRTSRRTRAGSPPARAWAIMTAVTAVVTVVTFVLYGIAGANSSHRGSGSSIDRSLPPVTAGIGQPLNFDQGYTTPVPATVTVTGTSEDAAEVQTVAFTVCARTKALDPLFVAESMILQTDQGGSDISASLSDHLPEVFYSDLAPHTCASGTLRFLLPQGAHGQLLVDDDSEPTASWRLGA